jgi:hypothetical protein
MLFCLIGSGLGLFASSHNSTPVLCLFALSISRSGRLEPSLFVNNSNWVRTRLVFQSIGFCPVPQIHKDECLIIQPLMAIYSAFDGYVGSSLVWPIKTNKMVASGCGRQYPPFFPGAPSNLGKTLARHENSWDATTSICISFPTRRAKP